jgi:hypothetical protein
MSAVVTGNSTALLLIDAGRLRACLDRRRSMIRRPHIHQSLRGVAYKIRVLRNALGVGMDGVAERSELNRRFALKKRAAQILLELHNAAGQRRLGDTASSGCPREIALLAERQKIPNLLHFHGRIPVPVALKLPSMLALKCEAVHTSTISFFRQHSDRKGDRSDDLVR